MNQHTRCARAALVLVVGGLFAVPVGGCGKPFKNPDVEALRTEVSDLKARVSALEAKSAPAGTPSPKATP